MIDKCSKIVGVALIFGFFQVVHFGCASRKDTATADSIPIGLEEFDHLKLGSPYHEIAAELKSRGFTTRPSASGWSGGIYFSALNSVVIVFEEPDRLVEYRAGSEFCDSVKAHDTMARLWSILTSQLGRHDSTVGTAFKSGASDISRWWSRDSLNCTLGVLKDSNRLFRLWMAEWIQGERSLPLMKISDNPNVVKFWRVD